MVTSNDTSTGRRRARRYAYFATKTGTSHGLKRAESMGRRCEGLGSGVLEAPSDPRPRREGLASPHWKVNPVPPRGLEGRLVPRVGVAGDAEPRVVGQYALQPQAHLGSAVGDDYLPRVQRIADPDAPAVVEGDPRRSAGHVQQRVEDRPVGDRVAPVEHSLSLAEGRGDAASVQMIAADGDGRGQLAARDEIVQRDPELRPRALPE